MPGWYARIAETLPTGSFQILRDKGGLVGLEFLRSFAGRTPTLILKTLLRHADHFDPWAGRLPCVWALISIAAGARRHWKKCRTFTSFFKT